MISNKEKNFISAVVYVYNNEKEIVETLKRINDVLKANFNKYEIICVNDASQDKSVKKIEEFSNTLENEILTIVNMSYYHGLELAMNAGVDLTIGDFVYEFDNVINDYDQEVIMQIYKKSLEGYDIVSASSNKLKNRTSEIFYKVFNKYSSLEYKLRTETFRILSRRAINRVNSISKNNMYRKALYANCGLKVFNLEYKSNKKFKRTFSKNANRDRKETAINSLILFTNIGYRFAMIMSFIMIIITLLVAIYTLTVFIRVSPVQGWTTTMLFLSIGFLGLFGILAIVIKYLEIILRLIFRKSNYMIESINKIN